MTSKEALARLETFVHANSTFETRSSDVDEALAVLTRLVNHQDSDSTKTSSSSEKSGQSPSLHYILHPDPWVY